MSEPTYPPTVTVTAAPPAPGDTAFTGADVGAEVALGLVLALVGVTALAAVRRVRGAD